MTANSISNYFAAAPAIAIVKQTNGQTALNPPGPSVEAGSTVTWTYDVTNPGNEPLKNLVVTDDNGTPSNPADDFNPNPVLAGGFNVGDVNKNNLLDPGEDWKYTFNGAAQVGQYENRVVTTAAGNVSNTSVTANSLSHYFALVPNISIVKETNGQVALNPPGPTVFVGTPVTYTYLVTNPDTVPLHNVVVTDDNGTPSNPADDFHPSPVLAGGFNVGDTNQNGLLDPGETWRYEATQTATAMGPYVNAATVTALSPAGLPVQAQTLSNHLNECPVVINVQRFGIHQQPTQIVVTFNGPLDPAQAENINNYHVFTLGPNGKFTRRGSHRFRGVQPGDEQRDADARPQLSMSTTSPRSTVTNPCPGGPPFIGVLNRKFSLGAIDWHRPRQPSEEDECAGGAQPGGPAEEDNAGHSRGRVENCEEALVECICRR